jgi:hypothetical protein
VQQISGEAQRKRVEVTGAASGPSTIPNRNTGTLANVSQPNPGGNLNFQQTFYQTMVYGPGISPMGSGPVQDVMFPRLPRPNMTSIGFDHNGGGGGGRRRAGSDCSNAA